MSELARPFLKSMSLPALSKHVKVLERAGLIAKSKDAQCRSCKVRGAGLRVAADWVEQYPVYWEESFDRLDAHLEAVVLLRVVPGPLRHSENRWPVAEAESEVLQAAKTPSSDR